MALSDRTRRNASTLVLKPTHASRIRLRAARWLSLYILVEYFDTVIFLFQAKGLARAFRIEEGGDNATGVEGVGFG